MYYHVISSLPIETISPHYTFPMYAHSRVPPMPKMQKKEIKKYLLQVLEAINTPPNETILMVTDANYLKVLLGITAAGKVLGELCQCTIEGYEDLHVVYLPNPLAAKHNPQVMRDIGIANKMIGSLLKGKRFSMKNANAGKLNHYPFFDYSQKVTDTLKMLMKCPELAIDVETTGLKFYSNKMVSISFSPNKTDSYVFWLYKDSAMMKMIGKFLHLYTGKAIYHNASFDVTNLVYHFFMSHLDDFAGMLQGIDTLTKYVEDTRLLAFVSLNSTIRPSLSLKDLAYEYLGKYEEDVKNILDHSKEKILVYNGKDTAGTFYIYEKYWQMAQDEDQMDIYQNIMRASLPKIIQMQLTGMPLHMPQVRKVEKLLATEVRKSYRILRASTAVKNVEAFLAERRALKKTAKAKKKVYSPDECFEKFNPNSPDQLVELLYQELELPVLLTTKTGSPATGGKLIERLMEIPQVTPEIRALLDALFQFKKSSKLLNTFIPAFKAAPKTPSGYRLFGNFNLGGTFSGRLSSSDVNLQQLPSSGRLGKLIKSCFKAPKGWVMVGIDYASLEDRVNALITKDKNKLKVYTDGFDGHCLRAYYYFSDEMKGIDPSSVDSINSIKKKYPDHRTWSKAPTFALTYLGTIFTLMNNLGWSKDKSTKVYEAYQEMYQDSVEFTNQNLRQACEHGFVKVAFGLKVRTPLLHTTDFGEHVFQGAYGQETRTLGNAAGGQSYGMLNSRAGNEFFELLKKYPKFRTAILPIADIHDAQYFMVKMSPKLIAWMNKQIVKCVEWQDLPELRHDKVKLTGELDVFHPTWKDENTLPHNAPPSYINSILSEAA
ncbi:coil containing protein [Vibrio phage 1.188.A._10N.286.51.A6]|uniref:Coil containing protein n=3 Tax=Mukerjeevirus mv51A6 TaxID=2734162 RepID=A0A2I7RIZ5_9CAUD|nr:DNA polymerase [Vibrio phage 1.188.A._10N.286.51.A6]AUR93630.1 coil containing protein [Vibrio phage 1.188.A._10N.286.51.A6]AUR93716.1 coil containing protein [Vibrio phage 1.188.B._10N.286.51.A6]AUR93802.1 coil containing protein [Vibrio phage 1.188.C._10N.286.51.A6]